MALPDFNAGAMENWGLITYRETSLLYDPHTSSEGNKERVLTVIAHELAHMVMPKITMDFMYEALHFNLRLLVLHRNQKV